MRSSEHEPRLSSSNDLVKARGDTAASSPSSSRRREIKPFHALREDYALDPNTFFRFRDRFKFPEEVTICLPQEDEKACHFSPGEVCFYKAAF